jgi:hypothetical protein
MSNTSFKPKGLFINKDKSIFNYIGVTEEFRFDHRFINRTQIQRTARAPQPVQNRKRK